MREKEDGNATKKKRLSKDEKIKEKLLSSPLDTEKIETEDLYKKTGKVEKGEDGATIVKKYEEIIHTRKKNIRCIPYQGKVFR